MLWVLLKTKETLSNIICFASTPIFPWIQFLSVENINSNGLNIIDNHGFKMSAKSMENLNDLNYYKTLYFYLSYYDKCKRNMVKIVQKQSLKKCTSKGVIIFLSHRIYSNFMQKDLCKNIIFNLVLDGST